MKKIADLAGRELQWIQQRALAMEYELRAGEERVASLAFRSAFGSFATAESADGCWTFKRVGFWRTHVTVRAPGSDADLAVYRHDTWSGGGTVEFPDGRKYHATTNFWQTRFELQTEAGEALIWWRIGGLLHLEARVEILPGATGIAELPWLMMLGFYLVVMLHNDAASAGAVVAAMG